MDYDLGSHSRDQERLNLTASVTTNTDSTARLTFYDQEQKQHIVPFVIEPSAGVDRGVLAVLTEGYEEQQIKALDEAKQQAITEALEAFQKSVDRSADKLSADQRDALLERTSQLISEMPASLPQVLSLLDMPGASNIQLGKKLRGQADQILDGDTFRTVLHLKPTLAPIKAAVFPLKRNNPEIVAQAQGIRKMLQSEGDMRTVYDDTGAIGKLYRRQDEIGTPFCITVDFDTLGRGDDTTLKDTVTVRDRDTMGQERVPIGELEQYLREKMRG
jgi:glycyl-tRNA synthetase